jgi:hypothetical protein
MIDGLVVAIGCNKWAISAGVNEFQRMEGVSQILIIIHSDLRIDTSKILADAWPAFLPLSSCNQGTRPSRFSLGGLCKVGNLFMLLPRIVQRYQPLEDGVLEAVGRFSSAGMNLFTSLPHIEKQHPN